ncbi:MAG: hypothetical protein ABIG84_05275 [archaeon]
MKDFCDTGIIIGTSYVQNITYDGFQPTDIDSNSIICANRFNEDKIKVICSTVIFELNRIIERRRIMHTILIYELAGSPLKKKEYDKLELYYIMNSIQTGKTRDQEWLKTMVQKLKKCDVEEVYHTIENIRTMFELNIRNIVQDTETFRPDDAQRIQRSEIKKIIYSLPEKPNDEDINIYSNSIIYHNQKENVIFLTVDKGYKKIDYNTLQTKLQCLKPKMSHPDVEILSS